MTSKRSPEKILNSVFVKEICHAADIQLGTDALDELSRLTIMLLTDAIADAKRGRSNTVYRYHVERAKTMGNSVSSEISRLRERLNRSD